VYHVLDDGLVEAETCRRDFINDKRLFIICCAVLLDEMLPYALTIYVTFVTGIACISLHVENPFIGTL
jgi:putative lipase involved disintegration of autophagic bodies